MVPLPCRMENIYSMSEGVILERIDDLMIMNTSFSVLSPIRSIPMYFSLLSPLAIPKPINQRREGEDLDESFVNLSRFLNTSLNHSMTDIYNSRIIPSKEDRDTLIVSFLPTYSLCIVYNQSLHQHSILRVVRNPKTTTTLLTEILSSETLQQHDAFIDSMSLPDFSFFLLKDLICNVHILHFILR